MYESVLSKTILNEKQAQVYCACLRIGGGKVPEIAREAGIKRTTAYGILDELVKLGLVSYVFQGKQKVFRVKDPEQLIELLAKHLNLKKYQIKIIQGEKSRDKVIEIDVPSELFPFKSGTSTSSLDSARDDPEPVEGSLECHPE